MVLTGNCMINFGLLGPGCDVSVVAVTKNGEPLN